jgi:Ca-activated chloride channel family protein
MRPSLAHALWMMSAATIALSGCSTNKDKQSSPISTPTETPVVAEDSTGGIAAEPVLSDLAKPAEATTTSGKSTRKPAGRQPSGPTVAMLRDPLAPPPADHSVGLRGSGAAGIAGPTHGRRGGKRNYSRKASKKKDMRRSRPRPARKPSPRPMPIATDEGRDGNSEAYENYGVNPMVATADDNLSTFAVDVDTASYAIARRKILSGQMPPASAVRVEEFVNYFKYDYAGPSDGAPFAVHMDAAPSPFTKGHHILRIGVQAKQLSLRERKPANLVFLVDVSGSMSSADKLGLAKRAMRILVNNLKDGDTVSMVTYAGNTRVVLEPTGLEHKAEIFSAIEDLNAGGSTAMGSGLELAYKLAGRGLKPKTVSRVIVLSDGDANVGRTSHSAILATIAGQVKEGVTLSTVGFGMGNYKDTLMEQLANKGNGNYYYIDSMNQARRVFQEQLGGTLEVVAKDVKIQVDFDKQAVVKYRLVGYENRDVADIDFRNDKVDAGEIGAGHSVTAIYEVELGASTRPLATVRIRAK